MNNTSLFPPAVDPDEVLLNSRQTRAFFGNASEMWIYRRTEDSRFPKPKMIRKRRFWTLGQLRAWRDAQFRKQDVEAPQPPRRPVRAVKITDLT